MSLETMFQLCQGFAMIGWLALAVAPLARERLINVARIVALVLAVAYTLQFLTIFEATETSMFSLAGVSEFFSRPGNVMLGWTHYLAFDLFVGSWEAEDAPKRNIPHWLLLPCLFLTLMVGPVGLLAYFVIRTIRGRMAS